MRRILIGLGVLLAVPVPAQTAPEAALRRTQFIADMDAEFRKMDADRDDRLTRAEIERVQKIAAEAAAEARTRQVFEKLDVDRDGQLSPAEFARTNPLANTANATPMLTLMDSNRDQRISLVEHRAAKLVNFDRLDRDKNGVVTATEMKAGGIAPR